MSDDAPRQQAADLPMPVPQEALERLRGDRCAEDGCPVTADLEYSEVRYATSLDGVRMGWLVRACPRHRGGGDA